MGRPLPTTRRSTNGKCGSNRCLGKASSGMGCDAFAYVGTGLVNGLALVIASGQNLKRLLQKRGWGRRPFPTEAMALMPPPKWETEASFSHRTRTTPKKSGCWSLDDSLYLQRERFPHPKGIFFSLNYSYALHAACERYGCCVPLHLSPAFPCSAWEGWEFVSFSFLITPERVFQQAGPFLEHAIT